MIHTVGSITAFSLASNMDSLADGAAKPLGAMDNSSSEYSTARLELVINLETTEANLDVDGVIELYYICSLDNTTWTDGISPSSTSDQAGNIKHARLIQAFKADKSMAGLDITWVCPDLSLLGDKRGDKIGELPPYWSLIVFNRSGSAIQASGNTARYQLVTYGT
jgi:hypothetical protein